MRYSQKLESVNKQILQFTLQIFQEIPQYMSIKNNEDENILERLLDRLKYNNYRMCFNSVISPNFATFLYFIRQIQIISLAAIPTTISIISKQQTQKSQILQFYQLISFNFLQQYSNALLIQTYILLGLLGVQLATLVIMLISFQSETVNGRLSKIITIISIVMPIWLVLLISKNLNYVISASLSNIQQQMQEINTWAFQVCRAISFISLLLVLAIQYFFITFHFQFSFKSSKRNALCRFPKPVTKQYILLFIALTSQLFKSYAYPQLFLVYQVIILIYGLIQAKHYSIGVEYINSNVSRNLGVLSLMTITFTIANICYILDVSLFKKSLLIFIIFFFIFITGFYLAFRSYRFKSIIIDDNTPTQPSQFNYVVTYILISMSTTTDKQNETYLSSLLRNHINNCNNLDCCCKNRNTNYDPVTQKHGDSELQAHLDTVFIKHFLLLIIVNSIIQFPKSLIMKLLHCIYYLQFINNRAECSKYLRLFTKKSYKHKISMSVSYAIFCVEEQFADSIINRNQQKGNQKIQAVKQFDKYSIKLCHKIYAVVQNFLLFWSKINNLQRINTPSNEISQLFFEAIAQRTLKLMNQIQQIYANMKQINSVSTKLREIMFYYSKQIIHDPHMIDEIKQNIRQQLLINKSIRNKNQQIKVNIFSQNTSSLLVSGINTIKWASTNSSAVFGYNNRYQFMKAKINNLMPLYFAKNHDQKVEEWLQTGKCLKMNNHTTLWASKQNGACFKVTMYLKVFLNLQQRDLEYFISLQLLAKNQIICSQTGQIYGCSETLSKILSLQLKQIQILRPNIQLIFPLSIQIFKLFDPSKHNKFNNILLHKKTECQFSGYIPNKILRVLQQLKKQRDNIYRKNKYNESDKIISNNKQLIYSLSQFLSNNIEAISSDLNGTYITVHFQIQQIQLFQHRILIFRINKGQINTISKYYDQLEVALDRLGELLKNYQNNNNQLKFNQTIIGKDGFKMFLNPKKLKKMIQNQQKFVENKTRNSLTIQQIKKRAQHRIQVIPNRRVHGNILKMKKVLYREGIISMYTYNFLTAQNQQSNADLIARTIMQECQDPSQSADLNNNTQNRLFPSIIRRNTTVNKQQQYQNQSDQLDQLLADVQCDEYQQEMKLQSSNQQSNHYSMRQTKKNKALSFQQSQTSSAANISLTTKIKNIKIYLKKLNVPKYLTILNIILILYLIVGNLVNFCILSYDAMLIGKKLKLLDYQDSQYRIFMGLAHSRILEIEMMVTGLERSGDIRTLQRYYLGTVAQNLKKYYQEVSQLQAMIGQDIEILSEMKLEGENDNIKQFFFQELVEITKDIYHYSYYQSYKEAKDVLLKSYQKQKDNTLYLKLYLRNAQFFTLFIMLIVSLVVTYHSSKKLSVITNLVSKIYPHQRQNYYEQFKKVSSQVRVTILDQLEAQQIQLQTQKDILNRQSIGKNKGSYHSGNKGKPKNDGSYNGDLSEDIKKIKESNKKGGYIRIILMFVSFMFVIATVTILNTQLYERLTSLKNTFTSIKSERMKSIVSVLMLQTYAYHIRQEPSLTNQQITLIKSELSELQNKLVTNLLTLINNQQISKEFKQFVKKFNDENQCKQKIIGINLQLCESLAHSTFKSGSLNSYYVIRQSIKFYNDKLQNWQEYQTFSNANTIADENKFNSMTMILINGINGELTILLNSEINQEKQKFITKELEFQIIGFGSIIVFSLIFGYLWWLSYLRISKKSSSANSYLLMIPFDILIQNPYIKLYIKNQIGDKSSM